MISAVAPWLYEKMRKLKNNLIQFMFCYSYNHVGDNFDYFPLKDKSKVRGDF